MSGGTVPVDNRDGFEQYGLCVFATTFVELRGFLLFAVTVHMLLLTWEV